MPAPCIASSARSTCVRSKMPGCGSRVLHVDSAIRTTLRPAAGIIATSVSMRSCGMYSSQYAAPYRISSTGRVLSGSPGRTAGLEHVLEGLGGQVVTLGSSPWRGPGAPANDQLGGHDRQGPRWDRP